MLLPIRSRTSAHRNRAGRELRRRQRPARHLRRIGHLLAQRYADGSRQENDDGDEVAHEAIEVWHPDSSMVLEATRQLGAAVLAEPRVGVVGDAAVAGRHRGPTSTRAILGTNILVCSMNVGRGFVGSPPRRSSVGRYAARAPARSCRGIPRRRRADASTRSPARAACRSSRRSRPAQFSPSQSRTRAL